MSPPFLASGRVVVPGFQNPRRNLLPTGDIQVFAEQGGCGQEVAAGDRVEDREMLGGLGLPSNPLLGNQSVLDQAPQLVDAADTLKDEPIPRPTGERLVKLRARFKKLERTHRLK